MMRESTAVPWIETQSPSFTARHDSSDTDAAGAVLDRLEAFRARLDERFGSTPGEVAVVIHDSPLALSLAHPWLPLARAFAAPASRRYMAGWFSRREIHVLSPAALEERASAVPGSREALELTPLHEYAHIVVGLHNSALPPPFTPASFARYVRGAWLCEGAATHLAGQTQHLRPAIARRLREGGKPSFLPSARDAPLLGGTVFSLLAGAAGEGACVELARDGDAGPAHEALERAFGRPCSEVEDDWRDHLADLTAAERRLRDVSAR